MLVELRRQVVQIAQHLCGHVVERAEMLFDLCGRDSALAAQIVHGGDELGHARHHRMLDRVHVLVGAAEHFLQQDVGFTQPFKQRGRIGPQHIVRFQHVGDGRGSGLLRLLDGLSGGAVQIRERPCDGRLCRLGDALGAVLKLAEALRHRRCRVLARIVDEPGDFLAVVHHRLGEDEALGFDRLHRMVGNAADFVGEFLAFAGQSGKQTVRLLVEQQRHGAEAFADRRGEFVGLAEDVTGDVATCADQLALGLARAAIDGLGRGRGAPRKKIAGFRRALADCFVGGGGASGEKRAGSCRASADRVVGGGGTLGQKITGARRAIADVFLEGGGALGKKIVSARRTAADFLLEVGGALGKEELTVRRPRFCRSIVGGRRAVDENVTSFRRGFADCFVGGCGALNKKVLAPAALLPTVSLIEAALSARRLVAPAVVLLIDSLAAATLLPIVSVSAPALRWSVTVASVALRFKASTAAVLAVVLLPSISVVLVVSWVSDRSALPVFVLIASESSLRRPLSRSAAARLRTSS